MQTGEPLRQTALRPLRAGNRHGLCPFVITNVLKQSEKMFCMDAWFDFIHTSYICNNSGATLSVLLQVCRRRSEPRRKNHWLCLDRIGEGFLEEVTWQAVMGKATQGAVHEKDARKHKTPRVVKCLCFPHPWKTIWWSPSHQCDKY